MLRIVLLSSMLVAVVLSAFVEVDNNLIEYDIEDVQPMQVQTFSWPYPYQNGNNHVIIQPAPIHNNAQGVHSAHGVHSSHGVHSAAVIVPSTTEIEEWSPGIISTVISCTYAAAKSAIVFILSHAPALIAGSILALGVCKMTSLCSSEITIIEAQRQLRSIASPDRLATVENFFREAFKKYTEMQ